MVKDKMNQLKFKNGMPNYQAVNNKMEIRSFMNLFLKYSFHSLIFNVNISTLVFGRILNNNSGNLFEVG